MTTKTIIVLDGGYVVNTIEDGSAVVDEIIAAKKCESFAYIATTTGEKWINPSHVIAVEEV